MREYVTDAIVLKKEPFRDFDARYVFFTKRFGKMAGKATSVRKITSKLAGHLEPGIVATVRFVERNGGNGNGVPQIADALRRSRLVVPLPDLHLLSILLPEGDADETLWDRLVAGGFAWPDVLRILGWDPKEATCGRCGTNKEMAVFSTQRQEFFCTACASKLDRNELVLLDNAEV